MTDTPAQQLRHLLENARKEGGIANTEAPTIGFVDQMLALCHKHSLGLTWTHGEGCVIRGPQGEKLDSFPIPDTDKLQSAVLSRLAIIHDQQTNKHDLQTHKKLSGHIEVDSESPNHITFAFKKADADGDKQLVLRGEPRDRHAAVVQGLRASTAARTGA